MLISQNPRFFFTLIVRVDLHKHLLIIILLSLMLTSCATAPHNKIYICEDPEILEVNDTYLMLITKFKLNLSRYKFCLMQVKEDDN